MQNEKIHPLPAGEGMWNKKKCEVITIARNGTRYKSLIDADELSKFDIFQNAIAKNRKAFTRSKFWYFNLRNLAWDVLIQTLANTMPVDLEKIAEYFGIKLLSYQKNPAFLVLMDKKNLRHTQEGFCCEVKRNSFFADKCFIFYKEIENTGRMRWTIAHEIGHFILSHALFKIPKIEREANMFAARILMPACVLKECGAYSAKEISQLCLTSLQASSYRAERLAMLLDRGKFYTSALEKKVIGNFWVFVSNQEIKKPAG